MTTLSGLVYFTTLSVVAQGLRDSGLGLCAGLG